MKRLLTALAALWSTLAAQETFVTYVRPAEEYFLLGMRQYAAREYATALRSFQASLDIYPLNHRTTAAVIMTAKTHFAMKEFGPASAWCDTLLLRYPDSEYLEDAHFTRGMCDYNSGRYAAAFGAMEHVLATAAQRLNREHSYKALEHIAEEFLTTAEVDSLAAVSANDTVRHLLRIIAAERLYSAGDADAARTVLDAVEPLVTEPALHQRLRRLRARVERGNRITVAVLLPLMNGSAAETRERKVAADILDGVRIALQEYEEGQEAGEVSVGIEEFDTGRDPRRARAVVDSIAQSGTSVAVIGPVFSDETMAAASAAAAAGLPLISPTATDDSVAMAGPAVFQANSTSSVRGKVLAQYAVKVLGAERFAIIASDVPFATVQADSFAAEVVRLGGEVVFDQRYQRGESDLRGRFRALRTAAAQIAAEYVVSFKGKMNRAHIAERMAAAGFTPSFTDSVIARGAAVNITAFLGPRAKELAESLGLPFRRTVVHTDSLTMPVAAVDVVFSPIASAQQIGVVASQIAYYNIRTVVLGTSEWNNIHELDLNRRYADGVIFGSERWVERDERAAALAARFSQRFNRPMPDDALFGYDVMSLLIHVLNDGALTREQVASALSETVRFPGVRNSITLRYRRVNSDLHILQFKNGSITKLQTYTYQP